MASSLSSPNKPPPKAASLLGLAVETRSEILKHLVGGVILHVSSNRTRRPAKTVDEWFLSYRYFVCCDVNAEEAMMRNRTVPSWRRTRGGRICEYKIAHDQWEPFKFERDDRNARRYFHMAIAKVNRQLYEESLWAFLEHNTFSFCEPVAWQQFRDNHTAAQLNHMRAIELFTMTPWFHPEKGYGEGDPYTITRDDRCWKFNDIGILKNVTKVVLGLRDPYQRYTGPASQSIKTIGQALDAAFGELGGLTRLKEAEVFIILDNMTGHYGQLTYAEQSQIASRVPKLASDLEAKLLAFNPHNIARSMHPEETQQRN